MLQQAVLIFIMMPYKI